MPDRPQPKSPTQAARRTRYGLNVLVAVVLVTAIVVLLNIFAYQRWFQFRLDLTATRQYSLSPQTEKLLGQLEGEYRIVTLLPADHPQLVQAQDLIGEYEHASSKVTVEHLGLTGSQRERFYELLTERFQDEIEPLQILARNAREAIGQLEEQAAGQQQVLVQALEALPAGGSGNLRSTVEQMAQILARLRPESERLMREVTPALEGAMPAYSAALAALHDFLDRYDRVYGEAVRLIEEGRKVRGVPPQADELLLRAVEQMKAARAMLQPTLAALRDRPKIEAYDRLRDELGARGSVVILGSGPQQVRVIPLHELFTGPQAEELQALEEGRRVDLRFQGEERITGALAAMELAHEPLVVFLSAGRQPALGPGGQYEYVAQRLRALNYEVKAWSPGGSQINPMTGQPMPAGAVPQPKPGQHAVWVVTPLPGPGAGAGVAGMIDPRSSQGAQEVVNLARSRLESNDGVLFLLSVNSGGQFGTPDPLAPLLSDWGITPLTDRVVMREVQTGERETVAQPQFEVTRYVESLPVTEAVAGMPSLVAYPIPLTLGSEQDKGLKLYPLVRLEEGRLFAETNLMEPNPRWSQAKSAAAFVVAAAAKKGDSRMVVLGSPFWAADDVTTLGALGPGTAEAFGALYPGNSELFVNSVHWLADLEQLVAASARAQDIRRVEPMDATREAVLKWGLIVGMPLAVVLAGLGVWVRRRGG